MLRNIILPFYLLLLICISLCWAHPSSRLHYNDQKAVFEGFGSDQSFEELCKLVNTGLDDDLPRKIREVCGKIPDNHRVIGHLWTLNDSIPEETLHLLAGNDTSKRKRIISVWSEFKSNLLHQTIQKTGLPKAQANAFISLLGDIHLLGDLEPDNTRIDLVKNPAEIIRDIQKNVQVLFKSYPQQADTISHSLNTILAKGKNREIRMIAQELMTTLYKLPVGKTFHDSWKKTIHNKLVFSPSAREAVLRKNAERLFGQFPGTGQHPIKYSRRPLTATSIASRGRTAILSGVITFEGKVIIPLRNGITEGFLVIVFDAGTAYYQYYKGDIRKPELKKKLTEAAVKGTVVGSASAISITLGANPGGFVILAVGAGSYFMADLCIDRWKEMRNRHLLTTDDLRAFGIEADTILEPTSGSLFDFTPDSILAPVHDSTLDMETDSILQL